MTKQANRLSDQTKVSRVLDMGIYNGIEIAAEAKVLRFLVHQSGFAFSTGGRKKGGGKIFVTQKTWARMMGIKDHKKLTKALTSLIDEGWIEVDREPGQRAGYGITEYRLTPEMVEWACFVWDTVWNVDFPYPGYMALWKRAQDAGLEFERFDLLLRHYYPEKNREIVLKAIEKGLMRPELSSGPEASAPLDEVSGETPRLA